MVQAKNKRVSVDPRDLTAWSNPRLSSTAGGEPQRAEAGEGAPEEAVSGGQGEGPPPGGAQQSHPGSQQAGESVSRAAETQQNPEGGLVLSARKLVPCLIARQLFTWKHASVVGRCGNAIFRLLFSRGVTIHSAHDAIRITILGVQYNILNNILNETEIQLTDFFPKHETFKIIFFVVQFC